MNAAFLLNSPTNKLANETKSTITTNRSRKHQPYQKQGPLLLLRDHPYTVPKDWLQTPLSSAKNCHLCLSRVFTLTEAIETSVNSLQGPLHLIVL